MEKQLTPEQANTAYRAMCELNNVGARINAKFPQQGEHGYREVSVSERASGSIYVTCDDSEYPNERYETQQEFAQAYGIAI